jgi:ankyrin repeat protein
VQALLDVAERKLSSNAFQNFLTHKDNFGFSPLNSSCTAGHLPVVRALLKVAKRKLSSNAFQNFLTHKNRAGFSSLNTSCKEGHSKIVKRLVRAWRELDEHDEDFNKQAFIKFIEQKNRHGFTPLNAAATAASKLACSVDNKRKQDYTDVLAYLLSLGANPDEPNKSGYTARRNFTTYKWPREDEMGSTNEPKKYLSSAPRHGNALFFRPVPPAKPSYYSVHHYRRVHHYRP